MSAKEIVIFALYAKSESGYDLIDMFTSFLHARMQMYLLKDFYNDMNIYEEVISANGKKVNGLVDYYVKL